MTTETTTHRERQRALRVQGAGSVEAWMRAEDEYQATVKAAIDRGIGSFESRGDVKLSTIERAAVVTEVDRVCDYLEEIEVPDSLILEFAEEWANTTADDPLRTKFSVAYNIELDLTNGNPVGDGYSGLHWTRRSRKRCPTRSEQQAGIRRTSDKLGL